jgi:hypothetical protein
MLCLYLIFAVEPMFSVAVEDSLKSLTVGQMFRTELFPILSFTLNNLSLIFVFCCFSVLYIPPDATPGNSKRPASTLAEGDANPTPDAALTKRLWRGFYGRMRRVVRYLSGQDLVGSERRQRILVVSFFVSVVVLTLMFPAIMLFKIGKPTNWSEYPAAFDALSGTLNAIVLAMLVARLDSKLIGLPSWLICILYFYVGVQPMFVVFELHPEVYAGIKTAVLWVVFIFKIYFFLIIFYSLQTGRMFNYFFCSQILNDHVETLKEAQRKARLLMSPKSAPKAPLAANPDQKHDEAPIAVSSEPVAQVDQELPVTSVRENRWTKWFKELGSEIVLFLRSKGAKVIAPETPPATAVEETSSEPSIGVSSEHSSKRIEQSEPVDPDRRDPRAMWFKGLGLVAIAVFAGSLILYVSLSEEHKRWVDSLALSDFVVGFHVLLLAVILVVICGLIIRDRFKARSDSLPNAKARFEAPAELILKLSEPMSEDDGKRKISALTTRTEKQFKSFTLYFRLFWISLLLLYIAMWFSGRSLPEISPLPIPVEVTRSTEGKAYPSSQSEIAAKGDSSNRSLPEAKRAFSEDNQTASQADHSSESPQIERSELTPDSRGAEQLFSIDEMPTKTQFSFWFFVINNCSVLVVFWCFVVLYIPNDEEKFDEKDRLLRRYSLLIFVLLTVLVPLLAVVIKGNSFTLSEVEKIPTILGAVGGTLNAVAFALLIARLDSRIIGLRLLMVTVLYAYASLQPLFVTFNQPSNLLKFIATSAMIAAFLFKICLMLMVGHIRNSGGLINYLWFFPVMRNSVNSVFGNQFEIKAHSPKVGWFTFSISNKNVEKYRAVKMYRTREECDDAIKALVKAMKERASYAKVTEDLQGTYWVRVKAGEELICESTGLREAEVDDLINESIEKVPYCKYDRG